MPWDFETDPDFQDQLDWSAAFVRDEVEPLDYVIDDPLDVDDPVRQELIPPLQTKVKEKGLWAAHLGPELGGQGYGQLKLALLNEILGQSRCAPLVFGCMAPDTGNAEILAHFGNEDLKRRYLRPLLAGEIFSAFSMTEPQGGSDPKMFTTSAVPDGDQWVVNGEKWMSTNAKYASFLIVMAVTDPDAPPYRRMSMFVVPADTPGITIVRNVRIYGEPPEHATHAYVRYEDVRVPSDHLLGQRGDAFVVAQVRLGGGRVHHAMRTVGVIRKAFDMMCERALSRQTQGERLGEKQMVQEMIADSWLEMEQFRLLVLRTAWKIDRLQDYKGVRADIAAIKVGAPQVLHNIARRAVQIHGSLGLSDELPLAGMVINAMRLGIADGASEVHKVTLAREILKGYRPSPGLFPTAHMPAARERARARYADVLGRHGR